jgi:hypothetical protein
MNTSGWKRRFLAIKLSLAIIIAGLFLVLRRSYFWPLVVWTMYGDRADLFPKDTRVQSRVRVSGGEPLRSRDLWPWDLVEVELYWMVDTAFEGAIEPTDTRWRRESRAYIDTPIRHKYPGLGEYNAEIWELSWNVDPYAVPPFDRSRPDPETLLGAFSTERPGTEKLR